MRTAPDRRSHGNAGTTPGCRTDRGCVCGAPRGRGVPGLRHGHLAARIYRLLWRIGEERGLGLVFFGTGFTLRTDPATVRVPDVAFVSSGRIPEVGLTDRFGDGAPDLAVEVVSPSNRASEMQQKALDYLDAGARLVWIVDPAERTVATYRSRSHIRILLAGEVLDGGDVLPDLRVPVESGGLPRASSQRVVLRWCAPGPSGQVVVISK